ncbi:tRNA pseudouridine(55) synthase TruB [Allopusillimonas soli]|uniref:tRNA pseudouridine synthase B n=1 Tax=Allopusillimonas soli TaxID=659016 RepID=A0A853FHZ7_9BURK|nr:tRNA pseudouridine(55) synthase TruB [Allopusillimonas soli]NYT38400.1 tRNA pseudouridine(55) synthase TruB [Allopusillimonas soli]TEA72038.1 tRNA pseudouridine(55) synthase TruB [Allopusillimonas soli]
MASRRGQMLDGVLLLDKPAGLSSNHALQRAKRTLDARKAGHTGTLDPFATGLLICCMGRATKICGAMLNADKTYIATLQFGEETDSGDCTGHVVAQAGPEFTGVDAAELEQALAAFRGEIEQIPPMYSALKRDGKPLYEYARQGIELERPPRRVTIHALELLRCFDNGRMAEIRVHCSKGTYIRTLAQDIGRALGCRAHLAALRRTQAGPFDIRDAIELETLQDMPNPQSVLVGLDALPAGLLSATEQRKEQL